MIDDTPHPSEPVHIFPVRVYFEDTDAAGIVYYANYLRFAERARTEMLRQRAGLDHSRLLRGDHGDGTTAVALAVRHCEADFLRPARLDDWLEVHTWITALGGATLSLDQWVIRQGEDLVRLKVKLGCMTPAGRAARLPEAVRQALQPAL